MDFFLLPVNMKLIALIKIKVLLKYTRNAHRRLAVLPVSEACTQNFRTLENV